MKKADPPPALCSACGNSSDAGSREYVDFEADFDGPVVLDEHGQYRLDPTGAPSASENIYLCFSCLTAASEIVGLKPERNRRQLNEIRRLELQVSYWKDETKKWKDLASREVDVRLGEPERKVPRPRVAA